HRPAAGQPPDGGRIHRDRVQGVAAGPGRGRQVMGHPAASLSGGYFPMHATAVRVLRNGSIVAVLLLLVPARPPAQTVVSNPHHRSAGSVTSPGSGYTYAP